jgi:hypothetical protein
MEDTEIETRPRCEECGQPINTQEEPYVIRGDTGEIYHYLCY